MAIVLIGTGHFSGASSVTHKPSGADPRSLADLVRELQAGHNTLEAALAGATNPFNYVGDIAVAADFPAAPTEGHVYRVTADCIDNDPTKTNTGQHFVAPAVIWWDGVSAWVDSTPEETGIVTVAVTPYAVPDGIHTVIVETVTIGGPSVVNLPAALALRVGRSIQVIDGQSSARTNTISVTPAGADQIDNVAAALVIEANDGRAQVTCAAAGAWYSGPDAQVWERLTAIQAGAQDLESWQGAAATENLRVFRATRPGSVLAVNAEVGTAAAAAESMTLDVEINGVSCLTGAITIDNTVVIDTPEPGVVDAAASAFAAGDLVRVVRTYVPGGAPTPMRDTVCTVGVRYDA